MTFQGSTFWWITGTQLLYGPAVIEEVTRHSQIMVDALNSDPAIVGRVVFHGAMTHAQDITDTLLAANADPTCAGVIAWMHTFSPAKMWITGLSRLQKPYLHFNTQFSRDIPWDSIDMDYMNLNQSAHGDREHGFLTARLRLPRKVIAGHWEDLSVRRRIGDWMRAAVGVQVSRSLRVCRFGDNMRDVAVTEGDKVEAERVLGWSVNTHGIGDLIACMEEVTCAQVEAQMDVYRERYDIGEAVLDATRYQARQEVALRTVLDNGSYHAFTDTFEDLQQLRQLPGLSCQNMMRDGYGFGAEGDWKTAALVHVMKHMAQGLPGGTAFMEDYAYHMDPAQEGILGAHMLEVDPDIAASRPRVEVHSLSIGKREDPARLCFETGDGAAITASLVDMGDRFRMIVSDVEACAPFENMPRLPVARVMWKPLPDLSTAAEAWIYAGGAHHTVLSYALRAGHLRDFCQMVGIEYLHIGRETQIETFTRELETSELRWRLLGK